MAKFGIFPQNGQQALSEVEGEWLEVDGDMVSVKSKINGVDRAVAVVRLTIGFLVKKTTD